MNSVIIGLAILGAVIWIVYKLFQAIADGVKQIETVVNDARSKRRQEHKATLLSKVNVRMPADLANIQQSIKRSRAELENEKTRISSLRAAPPRWNKVEFKPIQFAVASEAYGTMVGTHLADILQPNATLWFEEERAAIQSDYAYPLPFPNYEPAGEFKPFPDCEIKDLEEASLTYDRQQVRPSTVEDLFKEEIQEIASYNRRLEELIAETESLNTEIREFNKYAESNWNKHGAQMRALYEKEYAEFEDVRSSYVSAGNAQKSTLAGYLGGYRKGKNFGVIRRVGCILGRLKLPISVPRIWNVDFDEEQRILIVEIELPDVVHREVFKTVVLKSGPVLKPLNQKERKEFVPGIHPAILLRHAYEIFRNDTEQLISLLVVNGWVSFDDPRTGVNTKAYTASLTVERDQVLGLNLQNLDPLSAFDALHGKSAGKLVEIIPVEPMLSLNKKDSRSVDAKQVLNALGTQTNLAEIDWQDFEHLIRELFEKEFAGRGAEVKITQASRDRGVDAIVFDPDPIHGGKYVIQAKRYTNTVDVSAVRDLCAVVKKEGASRGILVTTSTYGAEAYAFANNEPVTLLNGAELLGLLKKHGYSFRINLEEARKANQARAGA
jgi:restriction system protein